MITVADLRLHIESDLPDASLQLVLSAVDEEVTSKFGSASPATEMVTGYHPRFIFLTRKATSLSSITETDLDGTTTILDVSTLPTADVRLIDGMTVERLGSGTHPRSAWAQQVTVVFATLDDNQRNLALIQLVKLELAYTGTAQERDGNTYQMVAADYEAEKSKIINGLKQRRFA